MSVISKEWSRIALGEIAVKRRGSVDPQKYPDETFELYSIPAHDAGRPDILPGAEIGSAKQVLEPDDVIISRIVPHIQRVWVVGPRAGYRQIGSGEWIAYRSDRFLPRYLRHVLLSPAFHSSFMSTVAGVGGSLLRARPSAVAEIQVPCPPLDEQRRIAAILDKADAIRRKRQQALALVDDFLRSAFLETFGDPLDPHRHLEYSELGLHCDFFAGNSLPEGQEFTGQEGGIFLIKVSDLNAPGNETAIRSAKLWAPARSAVRGGVVAPRGAVVFPKRGGAILTNKKRILERECVLDPNLMAVAPKPGSGLSNHYMRMWFEMVDLAALSNGSSVPQLNKKDLAPLAFAVPNKEAVEWFDGLFLAVDDTKKRLRMALLDAEALFASLSQRAFRGDLSPTSIPA